MVGLRVLLAFSRVSDRELLVFGGSVSRSLKANEAFSAPPVSVEDLDEALSEFNDAVGEIAYGGTRATARRDEARDKLVGMLRDLASYVQIACKNNLQVLLSSGFSPVVTSTARKPLEQARIVSIEPGMKGQLVLRAASVPTARSYEMLMNTAGGEWKPAGIYTSARRVVFNNLTPGTIYGFQIRAIGGTNGAGDWSDPLTRMAL